MMQNPFDDLVPGGPAPPPPMGAQVVIPRRPTPHPEQTPDEIRKAAADAAIAERTLTEGTPEQQQQRQSEASRSGDIEALSRQIDTVQDLYQRNIAGQGVGSAIEYLPLAPANEEFNTAGASLGDLALAAFRVPGVGSQSDRELAAFVQANQPRAGDSDRAIQQKLENLRNRVNERRRALGLPDWNWRRSQTPEQAGREIGAVVGATAPNVQPQEDREALPAPGGAPPGGPAAPSGGPPGQLQESGVGDIGWGNLPEEQPSPLTPDQQAQYNEFMNAHPNVTGPEIEAFFNQMGLHIENAEQVARDRPRGFQPGSMGRFAPPDISDVRGANANPNQLLIENAAYSAIPVVGPLGQAIQSYGGVEDAAAFNRGARNVPLMSFDDEVSATMSAAGGADFDQALARERLIDQYDTENNPYARLGGQFTSGMMLPYSRGAGLGRMAAESAGYGFTYGLGSGQGSTRWQSALAGGTIGAAVPVGLRLGREAAGLGARGVRAAVNRFRGPAVTEEGQNIALAAQAENIPISRPIVDPMLRARMAYLESSLGSGGPIREGLEATENAIEQRAGSLAEGGTVEELGTMGQRVQDAAQRYRTTSRDVASRVYDSADEASAGATVRPWMAIRRLDEHIRELSGNENTNSSLLGYLRSVRRDLVDENGEMIPKTVAQLRDLRTGLRGEIGTRNLTMTRAEGIMTDVLDVAGQDLRRDLSRASPEAARLYERADNMWRERSEEMRQVIERVIGPRDNPMGGEKVMAALQSLAGPKGDSARLERLFEHLTPDERLDVAATIADTAGRMSPNDAFMPGQFMKWARALSPSARRTIFGEQGAQSIENLETVTRALMDTSGQINRSRSGMVTNYRAALRDFFSGGVPGMLVGAASGGDLTTAGAAGLAVGGALSGATMLSRRLSARALMSPDMSRWIQGIPRAATPSQVSRHIAQLSTIATRDPAIAQEALGLQQRLLQAVNDNLPQAGRVAASPDEGPDQQQRR